MKTEKPRTLEPEQIQALLDKAGVRERAMLLLMAKTGMRIGEVCHLRLDAVELSEGHLDVPKEGKTGARRVPLPQHESLYTALLDWLAVRTKRGEYFFNTNCGTAVHPHHLNRCLNKWSAELWGAEDGKRGPRITPHMFRHTFATTMADLEFPVRAIQEVLGHQRPSTTEQYLHSLGVNGRRMMREWKEE